MNQVFTVGSAVHSGQSGLTELKFKWQKQTCEFLASVGSNLSVNIFDRHGSRVDSFQLPGMCSSLCWTDNGEFLVAITETSSLLYIWDATKRRTGANVETNMKGLSLLSWNSFSDVLAVATSKGNLLLYNRVTSKKIPILGKHSKAIVCCSWNKENILACGSVDCTFTLTNVDGDTVFQMSLKGEPSNMQWSMMGTPTNSTPSPVLSMVLSNKTLFFHSLASPETPIELAFQPKYGAIVTYGWFGDGFVMIGFSTGYFVVVSTNLNEIGQELFQSRSFKDNLTNLSICHGISKVAICGDGSVKVHELGDLKDIYAILHLEDDRGALMNLEWTDDGGFLSVGTKTGNIHTFLSRLPVLGAAQNGIIAFLTALREVTIVENISNANNAFTYKIELDFEPSVISIGPKCWLVGLNSKAMYYWGGWKSLETSWGEKSSPIGSFEAGNSSTSFTPGQALFQKEYLASVISVSMNSNIAAAALSDGRLQVHSLDLTGRVQPFQKIFPEKEILKSQRNGFEITCAVVTNEFLVYGTAIGVVHYYSLEDWSLLGEVQHKAGIVSVCVQPKQARILLVDEANEIYLSDPLSDLLFAVPNISANTVGVLWEVDNSANRSIFITWDEAFLSVHAFQPLTIKGPQCITLGTTKLPHGLKPIAFSKGIVTCQTSAGKLSHVKLTTHEPLTPALANLSEAQQGKALQLSYALGNLSEMWAVIESVKARQPWIMAAEAALHSLDIKTAKRIYRQILHDTGAVMTLTSLETADGSRPIREDLGHDGKNKYATPCGAPAEDQLSLAGHICVIFGDFDRAQEFFLRSPDPVAALEMRRDLMQWDQALKLAERLAPSEVTYIARECASRMESDGNFGEALSMFERALETSSSGRSLSIGSLLQLTKSNDTDLEEHQILCSAGITRMTFRMGDVSRGMKMLNGVDDVKLLQDCATILESIKMYNDAGNLLERAQQWEKAADVFIKAKSWAKVGPLLDKVTSPRIFLQYAKAKEAAQQYNDAALAYERGKDYENLVRIYVQHLHNIDEAVSIVRQTRSKESARIVSKFFQEMKDYRSVVEFLLMAGMSEEAFELAQHHGVMDYFGELVQNEASPEMLSLIAGYFENINSLFNAGKFYLKAGNYAKALHMFIRCPVLDGKAVEMAVDAVGLAKNDQLTHELIDYLMGETDGVPKDAKYIFKLYMCLGSFKDAARTAIIIAREEQALGNYRAAHDLLLDNFRQLKRSKAKVPADLERMLMLLHSYILVKILIRAGEHEQGARMLIRVANNISRFPSHVVPILTSTVIECHRAGFKKESFEYAAMLMRPEYRALVDPKYKRKIEQIVRRPDKDDSTKEEQVTPCPFCDNMLPETVMDCMECKNHLPYCIATGVHMTLNDWTHCPSCEFPALHTHFKSLLAKTKQCPMCCAELKPEDISLDSNPRELLRGVAERRDQVAQPEAEKASNNNLDDVADKKTKADTTDPKPVLTSNVIAKSHPTDMDVPFGTVTGENVPLKAAAAPAAGIHSGFRSIF